MRRLAVLLPLVAVLRLDAQPTGPTNLATTTHAGAIGQWNDPQSSHNAVTVTWAAATVAPPGTLDGYGVVWDNAPATIPVHRTAGAGAGATSATSGPRADGIDHWVHVRAADKTGKWGATVHLGPFYIDTTAPTLTASTADPNYIESGTVSLTVVVNDNLSRFSAGVPPGVRVQTALAIRVAATSSWDPSTGTWRGTVNVNHTTDGDGTATVQVSARDRAGNVMPFTNGAQFAIATGAPRPPIASNIVMHDVGVPHSSNPTVAGGWSQLHTGVDYRGPQATDVVATRSGTVRHGGNAAGAAGLAADPNIFTAISVGVGAGTEFDSYNHLQNVPAALLGNPPLTPGGPGGVPAPGPVSVVAGTKIGEVGAAISFGADTHTHWNRDNWTGNLWTSIGNANLNPLKIFTNTMHRDPGGERPRLFDRNTDGRAVTFFDGTMSDASAIPAARLPFNTPTEPIYGPVRISAEVGDWMNYTVYGVPYETGYWIEPRHTAGAAVRSAADPYILVKWDAMAYPQGAQVPTLFSYNAAHAFSESPGEQWWRYPFHWISNAIDGAGAPNTASAAERWSTKARSGAGGKDNGTGAAAEARNIEEARFADGTYLVHVVAADLVDVRQDLIDKDKDGKPIEVMVDNFAPILKKAVLEQAGPAGGRRYEATWNFAGATGTLTPAGADDRNPKWINQYGDVNVTATFSEPMRVKPDKPKLMLKDNAGAVKTYDLTEVPDTRQTQFRCTIPEADLKTHTFDAEGRQLAFTGKDLAGNDLDTDPKGPGSRNVDGTWAAYEHAPDPGWNGQVVDLTHKVKVDTKNDQKAEPERPH